MISEVTVSNTRVIKSCCILECGDFLKVKDPRFSLTWIKAFIVYKHIISVLPPRMIHDNVNKLTSLGISTAMARAALSSFQSIASKSSCRCCSVTSAASGSSSPSIFGFPDEPPHQLLSQLPAFLAVVS